jgi:hypothetical protein
VKTLSRQYSRKSSSQYDRRKCPGSKIRSGGKGRGLGVGRRKGPIGVPVGKKIPQVRIPIEKGKLSKFGYSISKSDRARHTALNKAVDRYGALSVWRKLNAQVILRKSRQPKAREVFEEDADWVREQFKVDGFVS